MTDVNRERDLGKKPTQTPGSVPSGASMPGREKQPAKPSIQQGSDPKTGAGSKAPSGGRESATEKRGSTTTERDRRDKSPASDTGKNAESPPQGTHKRSGDKTRERKPGGSVDDPKEAGTESPRGGDASREKRDKNAKRSEDKELDEQVSEATEDDS